MSAKRDVAQTIEDLEFLDESGVSAIEAAQRLGFATANAMYMWLRENDASDLWVSMHKRDPEGADITARPERATPPRASTLDAILQRAEQSPRARYVKRAAKIRELIQSLASDIAATEAEDAERDAARKEIEQLQAKLAKAKAKLRGPSKPTVSSSSAPKRLTAPKGEYPCRNNGCGVMYDTPQGRSMHERMHCEHREQAAS